MFSSTPDISIIYVNKYVRSGVGYEIKAVLKVVQYLQSYKL